MKFALLFLCMVGACWSAIIPADRRITWEGVVGVPGGVPTYATIWTNLVGIDATGAANVQPEIQYALDNCPSGQVVKLPAGTFKIESSITMTHTNVLRGAGTATVLRMEFPSPTSAAGVQLGTALGSDTTWAITSSALKGSSNLTLTTAAGLAAGQVVAIEQVNDTTNLVRNYPTAGGSPSTDLWFSTNYNLAQWFEIQSVAGNDITFWPPLNWTFTSDLGMRLHRKGAGNFARGCGVEDLVVEQTSANGNPNFSFYFAQGCWLKNVESKNCYKYHVWLQAAFRCEVRDSYFHDAQGSGSGGSYGISCAFASAFNLVENNIINNCISAMLLTEMCQGNAYAYNYSHHVQYSPTNWLQADISSHDCHPMMNLIEGNVAHVVIADNVHGSSSHNTVFRNYLLGQQPGTTTQNRCVVLDWWQSSWNVVGNVLGAATNLNFGYEAIGPYDISTTSNLVYQLGYESAPAAGTFPFAQTNINFTTLRLENYSVSTSGSEMPLVENSEEAVPGSLLYSTKPSWFGSVQWPPIGPDMTPMVSSIPAQLRYAEMSSVSTNTVNAIFNGGFYINNGRIGN